MTIGNRIKEIRQSLKYTQLQLAKLAGLTPAAICQYESGSRKPTIEAAQKIASALSVSVETLIGEEGVDTNESIVPQTLLRHYSRLSDQDKKHLEDYIKFLVKKSKDS